MLSDNQVLDKMRFLSDKDIVLAIHCENNDIVEKSTARMQELGKTKFSDYPDGRPAIAEIEAVSKDVSLQKLRDAKSILPIVLWLRQSMSWNKTNERE